MTVYIAVGLFSTGSFTETVALTEYAIVRGVAGKNSVCAHAREKLNRFELLYRTMYSVFFESRRRATKNFPLIFLFTPLGVFYSFVPTA